MKLLTTLVMAMCMTLSLSACASDAIIDEQLIPETTTSTEDSGNGSDNQSNNDSNMTTKMRITVNGHTLTATLQDNATARAIAERLPMTLPMMDLYGREMCYRFSESLPTDNVSTRGYSVGEIIYYPPMHSFVIMYEQNGENFQMQHIGQIDSGVEIFSGIGDVDVLFEAVEQ
ncbi:MAG: cyclophilin-like fold protein [Bacteroides sp.]|nr:cyclophilin-like fold protein [Bacteroides sp.]